MGKSIGAIEFSSIGLGMNALDAMVKSAKVSVLESRMICVGKYFVIITGDVADVKNAISVGEGEGGSAVMGSVVIASLAEGVIEKINSKVDKTTIKALGILETRSMSHGLLGADAMKKASNVELLTVVIRVGVGGKCVVLVTGDVAAVKSALTSGEAAVGKDSKIVSSVVIPAPSENMIDAL